MQLSQNPTKQEGATFGEITDSIENKVTVQSSSEHRNIPIIAPFGLTYSPPIGENTVLLHSGEKFISTGVFMKNKKLKPGELMLYSQSGANILLNNHGEIILTSSGGAKIILDKSGKIFLNNCVL
ncbi:MAG: hypothetical protein LBJ95_05075 [Oscillospiraceae bacterium]|jgi:phage gp45-like|nr:hypothetical protein [Oscillospiraceae bacterium]